MDKPDRKICKKCRIEKDRSCFHNSNKYKDGLHCYCKSCVLENHSTPRARKAQKLRREIPENKIRHKEASWKNQGILNSDGSTFKVKDYDLLFDAQHGQCAICGTRNEDNKETTRFDVDHSHVTGIVRGLLCRSCNRGLSAFKDNLQIVNVASLYLSNFK